jgi:hypothetical protein
MFTSHELCGEIHERRVETRVHAMLASVDDTPLGKVNPCDIHQFVNLLKLRKALDLMVFQTNASDIFQEVHWYT